MKIIVGLGNPGPDYEDTRHNIGFLVVSCLAEHLSVSFKKRLFSAYTGKCEIEGQPVVLAMPQTFMNLSGGSVKKLLNGFDVKPSDIIVVHDDVDLEFGDIRIKKAGGAGGHKGIISIIETIESNAFARLRIGISRPNKETADYVLETFSRREQKSLKEITDKAISALNCMVTKGITPAMNMYNQKQQINAER